MNHDRQPTAPASAASHSAHHSASSGGRYLFYSHDGLGLGHTRRNLAIARALVDQQPDASVLLATGADEINRYGVPPQIEIVKLPSLRKEANNRYHSRYLRVPAERILRIRSSLLRATVESFQPDVILADKHPLGVGGELADALNAHHRHGGRSALGLRDILDEPETVIAEWQAHQLQPAIERHYDEVLIYGQPEIFDAAGQYRFSRPLADRSHYCGYVCNVPKGAASTRNGNSALVLATPGGGEDGFKIVSAFLNASVDASWKAWAITGPMMCETDQQTLRTLAQKENIQLDTFLPNLSSEMADISLVVCMGGYNTLAEVAALGLRAVCIPRKQPRREQFIRAQAFQKLGLIQMLDPEQLRPDLLRETIERSLQQPAHVERNSVLRLDGAQNAARRLIHLAKPTAGMDMAFQQPPHPVSQ